jgi:ABC-type bacteriocin/lantibiotic exporter with double-glycine peptidase domain
MDEGTSALDRETERRVQENIDGNIRGITSVSIAHRLETI